MESNWWKVCISRRSVKAEAVDCGEPELTFSIMMYLGGKSTICSHSDLNKLVKETYMRFWDTAKND